MLVAGRLRCRDAIPVRNPYSGGCVGEVSNDSPADVAEAIASLRSSRRRLTPVERGRILEQTGRRVLEASDELARLITSESGLCLRDSRAEVQRAATNLEVAAHEAVRVGGEVREVVAGGRLSLAVSIRQPVGVVAAITPFNRPLNQVVVKVAPALAAGNRIILKPSEKAPLSGLRFIELLLACGLPEDVVAVVTGRPDAIGPALLGSADIDMVSFTGSVETGELVTRLAGIKKLLLELGGNGPLVVLEDADPAEAARLAAAGCYANSGQSCRGIKRILVVEALADPFVEQLAGLTERLRWGDPLDEATDVGPLISEEAARQAERRCIAAVADGARLITGGRRDGALFSPTILDRVSPGSELVTRETFAPVAPVIRVGTPEEALAECNRTRFGLQAGILTSDIATFTQFASELRMGGVALGMGPNFESPLIPFGGVKSSGYGREGISYAVQEMTVLKTLLLPWA